MYFLCFSFSFHLHLDFVSSSLIIQQSVNLLIKPEEEEAHLDCYHGDNNYPYMLWYRHKSAAGRQRAMELIGLLHYEKANLEKNFEAHFNITGHSKGRAQLVITNINPTDSAVYFCATSHHSVTSLLASLQKASGPITYAPASNLNCLKGGGLLFGLFNKGGDSGVTIKISSWFFGSSFLSFFLPESK